MLVTLQNSTDSSYYITDSVEYHCTINKLNRFVSRIPFSRRRHSLSFNVDGVFLPSMLAQLSHLLSGRYSSTTRFFLSRGLSHLRLPSFTFFYHRSVRIFFRILILRFGDPFDYQRREHQPEKGQEHGRSEVRLHDWFSFILQKKRRSNSWAALLSSAESFDNSSSHWSGLIRSVEDGSTFLGRGKGDRE